MENLGQIAQTSSQVDDSRILRGEVSKKEKRVLEKKLIEMYITKAKKENRQIHIITDRKEYANLLDSKVVFDSYDFYLLMDKKEKRVLDMTPVAYRLIKTEEGRFYAKLMR